MNARTALMEIPRCPQHKIPLIHREHPSADAYFCGTWYDCPQCAYSNVQQGYWDISGITGYSSQPLTAYSLGDNDGWEATKARNGILSSPDYTAARAAGVPAYASYSTSGDTVYNDDHSLTINGMTLGSSMLSRPMSDVFRLVSLNMGT